METLRVFRKKQIGIGDNLFLCRCRNHVAYWQAKVVLFDLPGGEADTGVALADTGMSGKTFFQQDIRALYAVMKVGELTETTQCRSVNTKDANIVEHGRFIDKSVVELLLRIDPFGNGARFVSDPLTVFKQDVMRSGVAWIVSGDDLNGVGH